MMDIDYSKLHSLTARQIISALQRDGFVFERQSGSHQIYLHPDSRRVSVSFHTPGETFPTKTLRDMIEWQAHWTVADLKRLKLIK